MTELSEEAKQHIERYNAAMHGMQTGVEYKMQYAQKDMTPKSFRVGVNSAMIETAAITTLLVEKGIITWEEWYKTLADFAERERDTYQKELAERFGLNITLA